MKKKIKKNIIQEEKKEISNIFNKFRKRDFSGTTGQAMKNSSYQLAQSLIFKFGSLLFTIIIARMLLPELFGLYSLALATIILFAGFSDLGIGPALITYGAKMFGKNNPKKAKGYIKKLLKWKLWLVFISSGILLASAYFIAEVYYAKPIFYALLVGGLYLPIVSLVGFVEQMFKASENFKIPMHKEVIFQIIRFIFVPLAIFLFLKNGISNQGIITIMLFVLTFSYFIVFLFLIKKAKKNLKFLKIKANKLSNQEIKELKKFILPLSTMAIAGLFFGYIDTLMLGHFVSSEFIAYYGVAFSLITGISVILGFMTSGIMPILAKRSGKALESIFKKTRNLTILISIAAGIFTYFIAKYVIRIAYGVEYLSAIPVLKWFIVMIILLPVIRLYVGYFTTQKKTKELAWLILSAAILNIIFNWFGITYGLKINGEIGGVLGAVGATILSRIIYLGGLIIFRRRRKR